MDTFGCDNTLKRKDITKTLDIDNGP